MLCESILPNLRLYRVGHNTMTIINNSINDSINDSIHDSINDSLQKVHSILVQIEAIVNCNLAGIVLRYQLILKYYLRHSPKRTVGFNSNFQKISHCMIVFTAY